MLSFADATGNLFNRLGKLGKVISEIRTYQGAQQSNLIDTANGVTAQLDAEPDIQALIGQGYVGALNVNSGGAGSLMQSVAAAVVNRMIFRDNPRINQNLTSTNTTASLQEVIRQMKIAGASVLAMTVGAAPTSFTSVGNGVINASLKRPFDGLTLENAFAEKILFTVTSDSYSGAALAGNEALSVTATGSESDVFAFDWPLGSNATIQIAAIDGDADATSGNLLTNSGFQNWTNGVPDNYLLDAGTNGSSYAQETAVVYGNTGSAFRFIGDAAGTLVQFRQLFDDSSGTLGSLNPLTQYSLNAFLCRDAIAPTSGTLIFDLVDAGSNVIQDANGVDNSWTVDLTGSGSLTTSYQALSISFRTPADLPDVVYLRVRLGNPLTQDRSVYLDKMSLGVMTQAYPSGPFLAVHAGSIPFAVGDYATCEITNSRGAGGTLDTFQTLMARLFYNEVVGGELLFPSSPTPTVLDGLLS